MKTTAVGLFILLSSGALFAQSSTASPLTLEKTIALPEGAGKFDHFAIDLKGNRLFIAATGNHSVEALDLNSAKVTETLSGLGKPHGLAWIPGTSTLYVSDGIQGDLKIFTGSPLTLTGSVQLSADADDIAYDAKAKLLYVGHGGTDAAAPARIAAVHTTSRTLTADIPVSAHPEGLDIDPATRRIFANIADSAEVLVIDGSTHTQASVWKLTRAKENVPLAYDSEHQLLFVGCRQPARLVVLDGNSGREVTDLPADSGADDLFYDAQLHRVYLIAGAGAIDVYQVSPDKAVSAEGVVRTAPGAKTGLFVPSQHALYIGAPDAGGERARILLYSTQ